MKAIKEVAKEQILKIKLNEANVGHILHGESKRINGSLFSDLLSFAEVLLTEAQRWIPVEEELPEESSMGFSDQVLTKNKFGDLSLRRYDFEFNSFTGRGEPAIVSWRPINRK